MCRFSNQMELTVCVNLLDYKIHPHQEYEYCLIPDTCDQTYGKKNTKLNPWHSLAWDKRGLNRKISLLSLYQGFWTVTIVMLPCESSVVVQHYNRFQVTWLTKYGHDYQKWWQPQAEETWPKINPRILRERKIWRLEVIHGNHFELFCS